MRYDSSFHINLEYLNENLDKVSKLANNKELIFMVKANAYGHGLMEISKHAHNHCGINELGVASLAEAEALRGELSGPKVYVFSDLSLTRNKSNDCYDEKKIIPVIASLDDLKFFLGERKFSLVPLVIHLNTGMNRLGIDVAEIESVINLLKKSQRKSIDHLMSHFACASLNIKKTNFSKLQKEKYDTAASELRASGIKIEKQSLANSGAIEQDFALEYSHVRPGLMVYGCSSLIPNERSHSRWNGKLIGSLRTKIISLRELKQGDPVGYGATVMSRGGTIAYVPIGYGDGFLTSYSGAPLMIEGHQCTIFGRVNMDMSAILLNNELVGKIKNEQSIELWQSEPNDLLRLADFASTHAYQVTCALSSRLPRTYSLK